MKSLETTKLYFKGIIMIKVKMIVDVYEDDYNEGEIRHANYWEENHEFNHDDLDLAISDAMDKSYYSYNKKYLDNDDGVLRYSVMVDEDNCEASQSEIEEWKLGNKTLYSANIEFKLYKIEEVTL